MAEGGGLTRFQRRMRAIPQAVRAATAPAVLRAAEDMAETMRVLAEPSRDTGALIASIAVTGPGQTTPPYSQPGGSMTMGENQAGVTVGNSEVRYPHLIEHGTKTTAAQPFFWPAVRSHQKKARDKIKRAMAKAIRDSRGNA